MTMQKRGYTLSFERLSLAMSPLHRWHTGPLARLHDVWLLGAPTPQSKVLTKTYDERLPQAGVFIERVILPSQLESWIYDTATLHSIPITREQAKAVANGDVSALKWLFERG
jgi:hypothetical protein